MRTATLFLGLTLACSASDVLPPGSLATVRSRSDQFHVTGPLPGVAPTAYVDPKPGDGKMRLEPAVLVVSCERIKQELLRALNAPDRWQGRINLVLRPVTAGDDRITVASVRHPGGWQYRLELPGRVEHDQLFRVLVRVLLQEMANRHPTGELVELPVWLTEGMAAHLRATAQTPLLFEPERFWTQPKLARSYRMPDPLQAVRERLRTQPALSFAELGQPNDLSASRWELFQSCAHLFVSELLGLPNGRAALQELLQLLPQHLNWQFAFMRAFNSQFKNALEVEKWWSVTVVSFLSRDQHAKWPAAAGLQRLDEILRPTVEVRHSTHALPQRAELRLQALIERMDYPQQRIALQTIVSQLKLLEWTAPPDLLKLVDDYRFALESYVAKRDRLGGGGDAKAASQPAYPLVRATVKQLDLLDVLRGDFKQYGITPVAASSGPATPRP